MDSNMYLKPSNIFYTQSNITDHFGRKTPHKSMKIGETLDDLCEGRCKISDIKTIDVTQKDNKWYTLDNRRLWVFHHLEAAGKCTEIPVNVEPCSSTFERKISSIYGGKSVTIFRGRSPGGEWYKQLTPVIPQVQENEVEQIESKCKDTEVKETYTSEEDKPIVNIDEDAFSIVNIDEDAFSDDVKPTNTTDSQVPNNEFVLQKNTDDIATTSGCTLLTNADATAATSGGLIVIDTNAVTATSGDSLLTNTNAVAGEAEVTVRTKTDDMNKTSCNLATLISTDVQTTSSRISAFSDEFGEYHHLSDSESKLKLITTQCNQIKRAKPYARQALTHAHDKLSSSNRLIRAQSELTLLQKNHTESLNQDTETANNETVSESSVSSNNDLTEDDIDMFVDSGEDKDDKYLSAYQRSSNSLLLDQPSEDRASAATDAVCATPFSDERMTLASVTPGLSSNVTTNSSPSTVSKNLQVRQSDIKSTLSARANVSMFPTISDSLRPSATACETVGPFLSVECATRTISQTLGSTAATTGSICSADNNYQNNCSGASTSDYSLQIVSAIPTATLAVPADVEISVTSTSVHNALNSGSESESDRDGDEGGEDINYSIHYTQFDNARDKEHQ